MSDRTTKKCQSIVFRTSIVKDKRLYDGVKIDLEAENRKRNNGP